MPTAALFCLSIFFSALVLFSVQPFMAKMILPLYGGSPAVWNTAMVFYQAALLAGYAWVHAGLRWLGWKRLSVINLVLFLVALLVLPPAIPEGWLPSTEYPALSVLALLALTIGLPFVLVSCNAPLMQYWFSLSGHRDRDNPYFLYAASNLGSMTALFAYPFLIEPMLRLGQQAGLWSAGFLALGLLMACCLLVIWRYQSRAHRAAMADVAAENAQAAGSGATWADKRLWLVCAAVPSALLLAVTNHITTDIAAFPLLWVLPLALYLLTFVVAFAGLGARLDLRLLAFITAAAAVLATTLSGLAGYRYAPVMVGLNLLLLFSAALVCHARLVALRPPARELTGFYLYLSVGGLLGSLSVAFLAPLLFAKVHEYYLAVIAVLFLLPRTVARPPRWLLYLLAVAVTVLVASLIWRDTGLDQASRMVLVLLMLLAVLYFTGRPWLQAALIGAMLVPGLGAMGGGQEVFAARSFYGAYLVRDQADGLRVLSHGTTIHGAQYQDAGRRLVPLTYYHPEHVMGDIVRGLQKAGDQPSHWAVVGLGTGAMACNARKQDVVDFFEIDPLVIRIARDASLFGYLADCPPATRVITGDARLTLASEADAGYDFIFLDAFSSDAIPVHILTREAMMLYQRNLKPAGLLVFHISNRHLDLKPVMAGLAERAAMEAWVSHCRVEPGSAAARAGASSAIMVAMAAPGVMPAPIRDGACWQKLAVTPLLWTDDYSNLLQVLQH